MTLTLPMLIDGPWITEDCEFRIVPLDEIEEWEARGWKLAPRWQEARHHLRYSIPMWRPL